MARFISYKEEKMFKRFGIVSGALFSLVALFEMVFVFVGQHYLILSLTSSLLLAFLSGQPLKANLLMGLSTVILVVFLGFLLLDKYLFKKYPKRKGALTIVVGFAVFIASYYFLAPAVIAII
ncbi:MAG: hypothetical protein ACXAC8_17670 [Candidatus Hodarchaeales archaeon]